MARNYKRDYEEITNYAKKYAGKTTLECIESYAAKRKMVSHRAGKAFWANVDDGEIKVNYINGIAYIA